MCLIRFLLDLPWFASVYSISWILGKKDTQIENQSSQIQNQNLQTESVEFADQSIIAMSVKLKIEQRAQNSEYESCKAEESLRRA